MEDLVIVYVIISVFAVGMCVGWSQDTSKDGMGPPDLGAEGRAILGFLLGALWPIWLGALVVGCVGFAVFKVALGLWQLARFVVPRRTGKSNLPRAEVRRP